jgi:hypothetical protein
MQWEGRSIRSGQTARCLTDGPRPISAGDDGRATLTRG